MMAEFPFSYKMTNNEVFPIVVGLDNRLHCNKTGLQYHLRRSYNYCEADAGEMSEEIVEFLNMSSEGIKSSRFASRQEVHDFFKNYHVMLCPRNVRTYCQVWRERQEFTFLLNRVLDS